MLDEQFSDLRMQAGLTIEQIASMTDYSARTVYRWENGESIPRSSVMEMMREYSTIRNSRNSAYGFTFIDLFAGIGGMRRAFEPLGGKCVFTSEWNKYSQITYRANYSCDHEVAGDITQIDAAAIPKHDLLLAGFPCQPFSIAGVSKKNSLNRPHGFHDVAQGTLFFDVARILEYHKPRAFLLENVKNLVGHDRGRTFEVIRRTLTEELGYNISYRVIDARFWVPQHRERIIIVGFKDQYSFSLDDIQVPNAEQAPILGSILHPPVIKAPVLDQDARYLDASGRVKSAYTLSDKLWNYLQAYAAKHRALGNGFGCSVVGPKDVARTLSARYYKDGSEILVKQLRKNPRRLTPRECSRLMGFDSQDSSEFLIPVSDTQAYHQFGNAVVVPVIASVAKHMVPWLIEGVRSVSTGQQLLFANG